MLTRLSRAALVAAFAFSTLPAHAVVLPSVYLSPASSSVDISAGTTTLELYMDFSGVTTQGGGVILDISGPLSFNSFTPSTYFNSLNTSPGDDTDFTGFGTSKKPASAEWEIHFGAFAGITGMNKLGDLTLNLTGVGLGGLTLSESPGTNYGGFVDLSANPQAVDLLGAQVNVVPLPATAWLFATGFGLVGFWRRRRA